MLAEVITISDELLIGQTDDTNTAWMGRELNKVGIEVIRVVSVRNRADEIAETLDDAPLEVLVGNLLRERKMTVSTAESCTGGSIAAKLTSVPGSSDYFKGGIIAYANEIKESLLGVPSETLEKQGAVSEETVIEMVKGAMKALKTDCAVSTSGIAGPGGGTKEKPVGTVWIAAAYKNKIRTMKQDTDCGREMNVERAGNNAFMLLLDLLK